jgi:hypothetical protein
MATTAMVDCYARHLLVEEHGQDVEERGGAYVLDGDVSVRVFVMDGSLRTRRVLVTAVVLEDLEVDLPLLLEAVNDLNVKTLYGRFFLLGGAVHVEDTVLAEVLEPATLGNAIGFVRWAARTQGQVLRERCAPTVGAELTVEDDEVELDRDPGLDLGEVDRTVGGSARVVPRSVAGYL